MKKKIKLDQLNKIAVDLINKTKKLKSKYATVVTLSGDLGVGKTTLTQEIAKILGVKEKIVSPTFVIMKKYKTPDKKFKNFIHIDAYRIEESKDFNFLNWEEIILDERNLVFIEWPEKIAEIIPENVIKVFLSHIDEETREINF